MADIVIRDPHISLILQGVEAQVREGTLFYAVFVAAEALVLLGAIADDQGTWLAAFQRHERLIAEAAARTRRRTRAERVFLESLAD